MANPFKEPPQGYTGDFSYSFQAPDTICRSALLFATDAAVKRPLLSLTRAVLQLFTEPDK